MTDPTAPILPDTNRWYTVATDAEALSLPGGALLRVAASSIGHGGIVFVPGVVVEPIGHSHHGYARIVAAPGQSVIVDQMNLGARSTWADVAKTLEERMPPRKAGRHADPSTAASRPVSELHLRPPTAQGFGPGPLTAESPEVRDPAPKLAGPPTIRHVADRVIGCIDCGKPAALCGDLIPDRGLCPWCLSSSSPQAFAMYRKDPGQS